MPTPGNAGRKNIVDWRKFIDEEWQTGSLYTTANAGTSCVVDVIMCGAKMVVFPKDRLVRLGELMGLKSDDFGSMEKKISKLVNQMGIAVANFCSEDGTRMKSFTFDKDQWNKNCWRLLRTSAGASSLKSGGTDVRVWGRNKPEIIPHEVNTPSTVYLELMNDKNSGSLAAFNSSSALETMLVKADSDDKCMSAGAPDHGNFGVQISRAGMSAATGTTPAKISKNAEDNGWHMTPGDKRVFSVGTRDVAGDEKRFKTNVTDEGGKRTMTSGVEIRISIKGELDVDIALDRDELIDHAVEALGGIGVGSALGGSTSAFGSSTLGSFGAASTGGDATQLSSAVLDSVSVDGFFASGSPIF
jgi:hypothetical protein